MLGQVDFSLLPVYFIDEISLYSGGSSIEKSNGALGGAISINNKADWNNDKKAKIILDFGSYGTTNNFLQFNLGKNKFKSKTRIFYNYSKNNFEFRNKNIADIDPETGEYIYPIQKNENGQNGNYYKFIIYNSKEPIAKALKNLKTKTSAVYDYSIGTPNHVAPYHACLPIWYGQKSDVAKQVVNEINHSVLN